MQAKFKSYVQKDGTQQLVVSYRDKFKKVFELPTGFSLKKE